MSCSETSLPFQGYRSSHSGVLQGSNVVYIYGGGFTIFETGARTREQTPENVRNKAKMPEKISSQSTFRR